MRTNGNGLSGTGAATSLSSAGGVLCRWALLHRWRKFVTPVFGITFFGLAVWMLSRMLGQGYRHEIAAALHELPLTKIAYSGVLTALSYFVLTLYDRLGFRFVAQPLPWRRMALASFIGYGLSNIVSHAFLAGAAIRFWIYTSMGIPATQVAKVEVFCNIGFWLGYLSLGSLVFLLDPLPLPHLLHPSFSNTRPLGILLLASLCIYLLLVVIRRPVRIFQQRIALPSLPTTAAQVGVAMLDILTTAGALWVLFPSLPSFSWLHFLQVFMIALVAGAASQVPAGLGVFETAFLALLPVEIRTPQVFLAIIAFRAVYYVMPLLIAASLLALREAGAYAASLHAASGQLTRFIKAAVPRALAILVFIAGAVLLFSGALPATGGRLEWLARVEPLLVIETSHFIASAIGVALILLARSLQRRLDAAYVLSVVLIGAGIVFSLAKGFDYEEAMILAIMLAALAPCRSYFYRRASLLATPLSWGWVASIIVVLGGSLWLYLFAFSHVEYSREHWWRFTVDQQAPRALRATVGAIGVAVLFAAARLLRPAPPRLTVADDADIERARPIVAKSVCSYANLVFRRDKAVIFSRSGNAFLMYGRKGRSWIAMGDPVGPREDAAELVWEFRDLSDRYGGWPVFFGVKPENLDLYLDLGLVPTKLGEEARIDLAGFDLAGPKYRNLRRACSRLARLDARFDIIAPADVPAALPEIARVSQAWLAHKATREKGFSNASFDAGYLKQFSVAVVRIDHKIIAFANIWLGAENEEMSIDLMRHLSQAPHGTMDFLFVQLMLWGKKQGYRWFNFGMAPLSGLTPRANVPLWYRFGGLVYQYGGHFYNFRGLRLYKEKFSPEWSPRYLASHGGLALPATLVDVTSLVAGGLSGILVR